MDTYNNESQHKWILNACKSHLYITICAVLNACKSHLCITICAVVYACKGPPSITICAVLYACKGATSALPSVLYYMHVKATSTLPSVLFYMHVKATSTLYHWMLSTLKTVICWKCAPAKNSLPIVAHGSPYKVIYKVTYRRSPTR